jgi:hypothetical protein
MDVISWVVGLMAGLALPSLGRAAALAAGTSISIRVYQYFVKDWGTDIPEDLYGAAAMIAVSVALAWIGSVIRLNLAKRRADAAHS